LFLNAFSILIISFICDL